MAYTTIKTAVSDRQVATITLSRPEVRNAMNGVMWEELRQAAKEFEADPAVRVVVLTGEGTVFSSGGDLKYQLGQRDVDRSGRIVEAKKLAVLLRELDTLAKPLIVRVNGSAFAGALSLIAVGDIVIGANTAQFAITEARIGMVPAMISAYVVKRIGVTHARRLFLTGRRISAEEAVACGLLNACVPPEDLDAAIEEEVDMVLRCGPTALGKIKQLIEYVGTHGYADNFIYTIDRAADTWEAAEGQEGMKSFLEKRLPNWYTPREKPQE